MDTEREQQLTGGNATDTVVRIGDTVRKPWLASTPAVHALTHWVADQGLEVPLPLGRDSAGRQILQYRPGRLAMDAGPLDDELLTAIGALVRRIHDVCEGFSLAEPAHWQSLIPSPTVELICHNDLAPWNLVLGDEPVFIDWDGAGPSSREWDLAYSAQAFTLNHPDQSPDLAAQQLVSFVTGYDPELSLRAALPEAMAARAEAMYRLLATSHAQGREPWGTMFVQGHGEHWRAAADYVQAHQQVWTDALAEEAAQPA